MYANRVESTIYKEPDIRHHICRPLVVTNPLGIFDFEVDVCGDYGLVSLGSLHS